MLIYIVVALYANGYRDERAFAFHRAARAYVAAHVGEARTVILEVPVVGDLDRADQAYTIRWNDFSEDTENIEAVYGNELFAHLAMGGHGRVEAVGIDLSSDALDAILTLPERIERNRVRFGHETSGMRQNHAQLFRRMV